MNSLKLRPNRIRAAAGVLLTALVASLTVGVMPVNAATSGCAGRLFDAAYIQPDLASSWDTATWMRQLKHARDSWCVSTTVIQWTERDATARYAGGTGYLAGGDIVTPALEAARLTGTRIVLGLAWDPWAQDATANRNVAKQLWKHYGPGYAAQIAGFYAPYEYNDVADPRAPSPAAAGSYYEKIASTVHSTAPGKTLAAAPTFWTRRTPAEFQSRFTQLLSNAPRLDSVWVQDRFGEVVDWPGAPDAKPYLTAAKNAAVAAGHGTTVWASAELYRDYPSGPYDIASMSSVKAQVAGDRTVVGNVIGFSPYHYYNALLDATSVATSAFDHYSATGAFPATTMPAPVVTTTRLSGGVRLSWTQPKSSDGTGMGFRVYRHPTAASTKQLAALPWQTTTFTDMMVAPGATYTYTVLAFNMSGATATGTDVIVPFAVAGSVLSTNSAYTMTRSPSPSYPDTARELTNGVLGATNDQDPGWTGWLLPDAAAPMQITVDLARARTVVSVSSRWLTQRAYCVYLPDSVAVSASTDGKTYRNIGTVRANGVGTWADRIQPFTLDRLAVSARYVRLAVTHPGCWAFSDEVTIRGS